MPERECDLVMKGGVSSGVVYAGAIIELGRAFRFRRIGGTSAGAIGAAVAAAAEYARRHDRDPAMAWRLTQLIGDLTKQDHFPGLLQPFRAGRPVLKVMLSLLRQRRRPVARVLAALWHVVAARWWWSLIGAAIGAVLIWGLLRSDDLSTAWTVVFAALAVLFALAIGIVVPPALLARAVWKGLSDPANRFGLCSGISAGDKPALTDWLHTTIQRTAGLPEALPLTFKRLRDRAVELAMISTELASARPLRLPVAPADAVQFWFDADELRGLFPASVCDYLEQVSGEPDEQGLRPLPTDELPVVVALRMSLSVPLLLACVPLYPATAGVPPSRERRSWFTDGGVTSNFPIHFFDAWLPKRPTFGLDLRPVTSRDVKRTHLPGLDDPPAVRWEDVDGPDTLLRQIVDAAQNWRDTAQAELPGFRDRICEVRLYPGEGGLHINMPVAGFRDLILAGHEAGRAFVRHFDDERMHGHRVRRYLEVTRRLQENLEVFGPRFEQLEPDLGAGLPDDPAYRPPFERRTRRATRRLLKATRNAPQPRSPEASPPPVLRIGPKV